MRSVPKADARAATTSNGLDCTCLRVQIANSQSQSPRALDGLPHDALCNCTTRGAKYQASADTAQTRRSRVGGFGCGPSSLPPSLQASWCGGSGEVGGRPARSHAQHKHSGVCRSLMVLLAGGQSLLGGRRPFMPRALHIACRQSPALSETTMPASHKFRSERRVVRRGSAPTISGGSDAARGSSAYT
jgi:hypothetical protein